MLIITLNFRFFFIQEKLCEKSHATYLKIIFWNRIFCIEISKFGTIKIKCIFYCTSITDLCYNLDIQQNEMIYFGKWTANILRIVATYCNYVIWVVFLRWKHLKMTVMDKNNGWQTNFWIWWKKEGKTNTQKIRNLIKV